MAPQRKTKLPKPLPDGFILTDTEKKQWRLGERIGQGGFGLIYLASQDVSKPVAPDTNFVIKVEYHENGPLFSELKFYQRAAKSESMQKWKQTHKLDFLGIPTYWGSGLAEYNNLRYRFMAMDRLGSDLEKVCNHNGGQLKKSTVLQLGQVLVDVLEYIHENEYVHADIKAANLLLGYRDTEKIYLADYGLSYRYCPDGVHKEYKENPKKGHNGTIEYTSLDAHKGVAPSRRGDLQILGFCLLHWLCGSLPWDNFLQNPSQVQEVKARLMENLPDSVQQLSVSGASTDELTELLSYVRNLDYHDKPDYQYLKAILTNGVKGRLDFYIPQGHAGESATRVVDPHIKRKKVGQARGSSKVKAIVDENMQKEMKLKPVPAGPCPTRLPSHHQKEKGMSLPVRRSQRSKPVLNYKDNSEDEHDIDEQEQEAAKFCPIPAYHYRGPPIGPKAQSKQKTRSNKTTWRIDARPMTSEQRLHAQRRKHTVTDCDIRTQAHTSFREGWEESHQQWSDPIAREAGLTYWSHLWYSYFFIGAVLLFMGGLLAFKLLLKDKINF